MNSVHSYFSQSHIFSWQLGILIWKVFSRCVTGFHLSVEIENWWLVFCFFHTKYYFKDQPRYSWPCLVAGKCTRKINISHFPPACFCCMITVWYNFSLSKSYQKQNERICVCVFAVLPDSKQRVEKELKMQCQNFDKQGSSAMKAVGKNQTKNPGLEFHPSLIWQQRVPSAQAEQGLESTTWPGWHLFTRAGSQLLGELTVSYSNQIIAFIKLHFSMLCNDLKRPG